MGREAHEGKTDRDRVREEKSSGKRENLGQRRWTGVKYKEIKKTGTNIKCIFIFKPQNLGELLES